MKAHPSKRRHAMGWAAISDEMKQEVIQRLSLRSFRSLIFADLSLAKEARDNNIIPAGEWLIGIRNNRPSIYNRAVKTWLRLHTFPRRWLNSMLVFQIAGCTRSGLFCFRVSRPFTYEVGDILVCNPLFKNRCIQLPEPPSKPLDLFCLFVGIQDHDGDRQEGDRRDEFRVIVIQIRMNYEGQVRTQVDVEFDNQPICWVYDSVRNSWDGWVIPLAEEEFAFFREVGQCATTFHGHLFYFLTYTSGLHFVKAFDVITGDLHTICSITGCIYPVCSPDYENKPYPFIFSAFVRPLICAGKLVVVEIHTEQHILRDRGGEVWTAAIVLRVFNDKTCEWHQISKKPLGVEKAGEGLFEAISSASGTFILVSLCHFRSYLLYDMIQGTWSKIAGARRLSGPLFPAYLSTCAQVV